MSTSAFQAATGVALVERERALDCVLDGVINALSDRHTAAQTVLAR